LINTGKQLLLALSEFIAKFANLGLVEIRSLCLASLVFQGTLSIGLIYGHWRGSAIANLEPRWGIREGN
jgi:hypothetical protein